MRRREQCVRVFPHPIAYSTLSTLPQAINFGLYDQAKRTSYSLFPEPEEGALKKRPLRMHVAGGIGGGGRAGESGGGEGGEGLAGGGGGGGGGGERDEDKSGVLGSKSRALIRSLVCGIIAGSGEFATQGGEGGDYISHTANLVPQSQTQSRFHSTSS